VGGVFFTRPWVDFLSFRVFMIAFPSYRRSTHTIATLQRFVFFSFELDYFDPFVFSLFSCFDIVTPPSPLSLRLQNTCLPLSLCAADGLREQVVFGIYVSLFSGLLYSLSGQATLLFLQDFFFFSWFNFFLSFSPEKCDVCPTNRSLVYSVLLDNIVIRISFHLNQSLSRFPIEAFASLARWDMTGRMSDRKVWLHNTSPSFIPTLLPLGILWFFGFPLFAVGISSCCLVCL